MRRRRVLELVVGILVALIAGSCAAYAPTLNNPPTQSTSGVDCPQEP